MKIFERTDQYLNDMRKEIKRCPRCGWDIQTTTIKYETHAELKCHVCGLIIETDTQKNRLINGLFAVGILGLMVGFIIGVSIF